MAKILKKAKTIRFIENDKRENKYKVIEGIIEFKNKKDYEEWETLKRICKNLKQLKKQIIKLNWDVRCDLDIAHEQLVKFFETFEETFGFYIDLLIEKEVKGLQ